MDLALAAVQSLQGGLVAGAVEMDVENSEVVEENLVEERLLKRARRMHQRLQLPTVRDVKKVTCRC